jgi:hypothetical protein
MNDETEMDTPVKVGQVVKMEPVFEDGELVGFAIVDAETGEVLTRVPRANITVE